MVTGLVYGGEECGEDCDTKNIHEANDDQFATTTTTTSKLATASSTAAIQKKNKQLLPPLIDFRNAFCVG